MGFISLTVLTVIFALILIFIIYVFYAFKFGIPPKIFSDVITVSDDPPITEAGFQARRIIFDPNFQTSIFYSSVVVLCIFALIIFVFSFLFVFGIKIKKPEPITSTPTPKAPLAAPPKISTAKKVVPLTFTTNLKYEGNTVKRDIVPINRKPLKRENIERARLV